MSKRGDYTMIEKDFNKTFSKNLNYFLNLNNKTQLDLAKYVNVSTASVSNWCKGIKTPRMDKVDMICRYFGILRSELLEDDGPIQRDKRLKEEKLLTHYNSLNNKGKTKVIEYASDLSHNSLYTNDTEHQNHLTVKAAHNDFSADEDEQMLIQNDLADLKNLDD